MNQEDQSKIDGLKDSLYSRNAPNIRTKRRLHFQDQQSNVQPDWEHKEEPIEPVQLNDQYKDNSMSFFTKILIGSIIFFALALGLGAFLVLNGENIVSPDNVDINIVGPVSVAGGEPLSFDVQVSNQNNVTLETVDLAIDFPPGTTYADGTLQELKSFRQLIDDIRPGGVGQKTIEAIIYGEENTKKEIKVAVEYRVKNSNAIFLKEKVFDVLISSSPITVSVSSFDEVNSGQEFEMEVIINSNSKEVIRNLLLKATYPFGYTFTSSDLPPVSGNNTWSIGDVPPGGKKTIKIKGKLEGQDDEARVFRFVTGAASFTNNNVIGTEYISATQEVSIQKPFMNVGITIDGDSTNTDHITTFNDNNTVDITYFNNLLTPINNTEIRVKLSGTALDKSSVFPEDGLYRSTDNEIIWNSNNTGELRNIEAGGSGKVSFRIVPRDMSNSSQAVVNPNIKIDVSVRGRRTSEANVPENIVSTAAREIKVSSNPTLGGQVVRSIGPFENSGPIPPRAEQQTTYTVIWTIENTSSSLSSAQVRSTLPSYVKWVGKVDPSNESINYNSVSGELVWDAGRIEARSSVTPRRKQVMFQVALEPSITQVGEVPQLLGPSVFIAKDDFTGETLQSNLGALTTRFSTDPSFSNGSDVVGQ